MKIAVIGAGGVGGYFGGKIAKAGFDITFIARGETMKALRERGLVVKSIEGDFWVEKVKVTDNLHEIADAGLIILATKAWQVAEIAGKLKGIISPEATILPLQNGVLAFDEISAEVGKKRVVAGLCRIFSKIEAPGIIVHLGIKPTIIFGEIDNITTERTLLIQEVLERSGIQTEISDDIQADLWKKFINICASGLLAVSRSTYGEIREMKQTRQMMTDLFEEIYTLSQRIGVSIHHDFIDKTLAFIDTYSYDATSSLTRDVWEEKPSEIEYQNGSVVRLGEKYGVKTPVNRFIYNCILPMERRARGASKR